MNKTEITQKQKELRKILFRTYELEKELTQEFLANHPNLVGSVLKYKTSHATTFKKVTGILSYDSTMPKLILQCAIASAVITASASHHVTPFLTSIVCTLFCKT